MPTQRTETNIEVLPDGQLNVRESRFVTDDDGDEYPPKHHRVVVDVDDQVGGKPWKYGPDLARIRAVRDAVHTPDVVAARRAARAANAGPPDA